MSWPDIQHSQMNTSGDVDILPPDVVGGVGHSVPPEGSTSPPYVQVLNEFNLILLRILYKYEIIKVYLYCICEYIIYNNYI